MIKIQWTIMLLESWVFCYYGYRWGWWAPGQQHWRTFNRLVGAIRE